MTCYMTTNVVVMITNVAIYYNYRSRMTTNVADMTTNVAVI